MIKPITFQQYWNTHCEQSAFKSIRKKDKETLQNCWNFAMDQATLICNNKDKEYEDSAIIDKDVIIDIAAAIESLKSE